jgi:uncharacterized membrane protein
MSIIKKKIVSAIKVLGLMAFVAALAATAFPSHSYAATATRGDYGKIVVSVSSSLTGQAIDNADLVILDEKGNPVVQVNLGQIDTRTFVLPKGIYTVIVAADGYNKASQKVELAAGETQKVALSLTPRILPNSDPVPTTSSAIK